MWHLGIWFSEKKNEAGLFVLFINLNKGVLWQSIRSLKGTIIVFVVYMPLAVHNVGR